MCGIVAVTGYKKALPLLIIYMILCPRVNKSEAYLNFFNFFVRQ